MNINKLVEYTKNDQTNNLNLFSTKVPRDAIAGTSSGLKNLGKGVLGGLCSLTIIPYTCAKEEGISGFIKGIGIGLLGGIFLPVAGMFTGSVQILKGILNTPEAITSNMDGKIWDYDTRTWIIYNLKEETDEIFKISEKEFLNNLSKTTTNNPFHNNTAVETEYYNILEIEPSASEQDIKRSYYKMAKKYHPDKSTHSESEEKFKKIGEAYQILGNPELRNKYDKHGKSSIEHNNIIDSKEFYCFLFGNDELKFYIDELTISMIMSIENDTPHELISFKQKRRVVTLANNIIELLEPYINNLENLEDIYKHKRDIIKITPFGNMITNLLGSLYIEISQSYSGNISYIMNYLEEGRRGIINKYKMASSVMKIVNKNTDNVNNAESFIEFMISFIIIDIETTIKKSCFKILNDNSVSKEIRNKRAEGLLFIGKIFYNCNDNDSSLKFLLNKLN